MMEEQQQYDIQVKVVRILKEGCAAGHKLGDTYRIGIRIEDAGLCWFALASLIPYISLFRYGGQLPSWAPGSEDPDAVVVECPDPENPVHFEVRRMRKQDTN